MIVVKIEMWPGGYETNKKEIGRMYVTNDGTGSKQRGNYKARVCRRGSTDINGPATRQGRVKRFARQSYNVWRLIMRALKDCFPEEA